MASRPFQFWEKKRSKIRKRAAKNFEGLAALSIHSAERRTAVKAGCKPVHFGLDGCPLSCYFSGNVATLRDTLSTSRGVGRGAGAFIYALSADETSPALAASRHTITALFSCRFKCPCLPRRQRHFHSNADRAYNTLHFASKVVCQRVTLWKPCFVGVCSHTSCKTQNKRLQSAVKITAGLTAYFVSARQFSLSYP